jgi:site-specific DNA recombinase
LFSKLKVVYARVSSEQQNLDMQLEAAKPFIKDYHPDEIIYLSDDGVSATKKKLEERPKMQELLELIRNEQVDTLIVYQRDRLARDFYEYLEIILLIYTYKVNVIFTATGHLPFNHDLESGMFSEGVFGMLSQIEGMNIANRTGDAFQKAPHSIFGYIVERSGSSKTYTVNPEYKAIIKKLYKDCLSIKTSKDLIELLLRYKSIIKRKETDVFNILIRPFYAGYVEVNGNYERLSDVPAIITLDQFKEIQEKLNELAPNLNLSTLKNDKMPSVVPRCHKCNEPLVPSNYLETDLLKCKKHKKVFIRREVFDSLIDEVMTDTIKNTNLNQIEEQTLATLQRLQSTIANKKAGIQRNFEQVQMKMLTQLNFAKEKGLVYEMEHTLFNLQDEYRKLVENEVKIEKLSSEVGQLVNVVIRKLEALPFNEYREIVIKSFIKDAIVHDGYVNFELYYSDFYRSNAG